MRKGALILGAAAILTGCIPRVTLKVETRSADGTVIDAGEITPTSAAREFRVSGGGSVTLTAEAQSDEGLGALRIEGGYTCGAAGAGEMGSVQQGTFDASHPDVSTQRLKTATLQRQFGNQCAGGTLTGSARACAAAGGGDRSCTEYARFK